MILAGRVNSKYMLKSKYSQRWSVQINGQKFFPHAILRDLRRLP